MSDESIVWYHMILYIAAVSHHRSFQGQRGSTDPPLFYFFVNQPHVSVLILLKWSASVLFLFFFYHSSLTFFCVPLASPHKSSALKMRYWLLDHSHLGWQTWPNRTVGNLWIFRGSFWWHFTHSRLWKKRTLKHKWRGSGLPLHSFCIYWSAGFQKDELLICTPAAWCPRVRARHHVHM